MKNLPLLRLAIIFLAIALLAGASGLDAEYSWARATVLLIILLGLGLLSFTKQRVPEGTPCETELITTN